MARKSVRHASAMARNLLISSTTGISSMTDVDSNEIEFQCASCGMTSMYSPAVCRKKFLDPAVGATASMYPPNRNAPQSTTLTPPHPKLVRGARRVESAAPRDLPCRDTLAAVAATAHRPE